MTGRGFVNTATLAGVSMLLALRLLGTEPDSENGPSNVIPPISDDRWCAVGDSITHGGDWTRFIFLYYVTRFPEKRSQFVNCGIGGDTAPGAVRRFAWDIAPKQPAFVTVMFGVNDSWWEFNKHTQPDDFIEATQALVVRLQSLNSRVVLIAPPPYDSTAQDQSPVDPSRQHLPRYVTQLREYATSHSIPLLDFYGPMNDIAAGMQAKNPSFSLFANDRVHPLESGHFVMAYLFLKAQRVPSLVSETVLDAARKQIVHVENAEIRDVKLDRAGASFELLEKALPFPVTDLGTTTLDLVPFVKELNQEILRVDGLAPGAYALRIDEMPVAAYSAEELAKGVNLATADTPQSKQARQVAELNARRHTITGLKLRTISMMEHGQFKRNFASDDAESPRAAIEEIASTVADPIEAEKVRRSFDQYLEYKAIQSKLIREGEETIDRIFRENKPAWHRFRIAKQPAASAAQPGK